MGQKKFAVIKRRLHFTEVAVRRGSTVYTATLSD